MAKSTLRYDRMVENALRGVVREALSMTAERGLPGAHHFYITFRTSFPGVDIPDFLSTQYPQDMTIVLEHQFWGLEVDEAKFSVTLSFRNQPQRLTIPFAAITEFADPSVKFGLEFPSAAAQENPDPGSNVERLGQPATPLLSPIMTAPQDAEAMSGSPDSAPAPAEAQTGEAQLGEGAEAPKAGEVVRLDLFRKK